MVRKRNSLLLAWVYSKKPLFGTGDIYVAFADREVFGAFSGEYASAVRIAAAEAEAVLPYARAITLYENYGLVALNEYAGKMQMLG